MASFNNSSFALLVFALVVAQMLAVAAAAPDGGVGHRKLLFGSDFDLQGLGQGLVNDLGNLGEAYTTFTTDFFSSIFG